MRTVKNILTKLFNKIDENIKKSKNRFEYIVKFFKTMSFRVQTEVKLMKGLENFVVENKVYKKDKYEVVKNLKFAKCVQTFNKDFKSFQEAFHMLERRLENQIIQKVLRDRLSEFEAKLEGDLKEIRKKNKQLQRTAIETQKIQKRFLRNFASSLRLNSKGRRDSENHFDHLLILLTHISQIATQLSDFEQNFFQLHRYAIELEQNRNQAIKQSLVAFINILDDFFGEDKLTSFRESKELLINMNLDDFAEDSFNIQKLLSSDQKSFIISKTQKNAISLRTIHECISQCLQLSQERLLEHFCNARYQGRVVGGNLNTSSKDVIIFQTPDLFYSIYSLQQNSMTEKITAINAQDLVLDSIVNGVVKFSYKEKGFIWDTERHFEVKLKSQDVNMFNESHFLIQKAFHHDPDKQQITRPLARS